MSYTKAQIYNLALSALNLTREISNPSTDTTNEGRVLNLHYDTAFNFTLQDLDLDQTSAPITLELIADLRTTDPDNTWNYVYDYPTNCVFLRRLVSGQDCDTRSTHIAKRTGLYGTKKAIYTNEVAAVAECISSDIPLSILNPMAGMAVAYQLAMLSSPLLTGKGSSSLRQKLEGMYLFAKQGAQKMDAQENFNYEADDQRSEFVAARLE